MNKYIVIKSRKNEFEKPIILSKNEKVKIIEESDPNEWAGWLYCKTNNNEGWVPYQIIEKIEDDTGIINEDYNATEFDIDKGEILIGIKELNGWILCYKENHPKQKAWAPLDFLKKI